MINIITFIVIIILIFINGFTDAPNAITTVVSTKVLSFRKASFLSALFNILGIIIMSMINISVADCISSIVILEKGVKGIIGLCSAMMSVVIFSSIASILGIPTSETHGLVAGLTGSALVIGNFSNVNLKQWLIVIIGLIWSVVGTYIIVILIYKILKNILSKININTIKKYQLYTSYGLSFVHGAQDGQKFIGIIILFTYLLREVDMPNNINILNNIWMIIFVSIIMFFGVALGGRRIVEHVGNKTVKLDNVKGIFSDVSTIITLFIASFIGIPVSTSHVKTISIIALGGGTINMKNVYSIFKAWFLTFPVCLGLSYIISKIMLGLII